MNNAATPDAGSSGSSAIASTIQKTLLELRNLETAHNRSFDSVSLLAVSKTKPVEMIRAAMTAGQRDFGENYLDEALQKIAELREEACIWHFIGQIQSNKTSAIATHFDWVHGIDREKIATRLSQQRPAHLPPLNCCIQLNIDQESSKAGILPADLPKLCQHMTELPNLNLRGLMCIPAPRDTQQQQRQIFKQVNQALLTMQQDFPQMDTLSMGMSGDLEAAVAEGSTMVRIGTAIFGRRPAKPPK